MTETRLAMWLRTALTCALILLVCWLTGIIR